MTTQIDIPVVFLAGNPLFDLEGFLVGKGFIVESVAQVGPNQVAILTDDLTVSQQRETSIELRNVLDGITYTVTPTVTP